MGNEMDEWVGMGWGRAEKIDHPVAPDSKINKLAFLLIFWFTK